MCVCVTYAHPINNPENTKLAALLGAAVLVGSICDLVRVGDAVVGLAAALVHVLEAQPVADLVNQRRALEHGHLARL